MSGVTTALHPSPHTAAALQNEAEMWQGLAKQQQDIASWLQRAAMHQREIIGRTSGDDSDAFTSQLRQFEQQLLTLTATAFTLEGRALENAQQAIRKAHGILSATTEASFG